MQALGRSAHREAIAHLEAPLAALPRLPEGSGRDQAELVALMAMGPALIATRGFASPEVEAAYDRARMLELAAAYGARSPELRAALRLCLLPPGVRPEDARDRLRRLYDRFEEGFATPDLRLAARLSGAAPTR